ncbi:hypothetical protein RVR_P218 (plasmid) [Actinacidiphila reveromycinica]|uniref:ATPase n=1 Tax=Actinacidiphila reveromycinica TaxID=659352 RepID=A0A7R6QCQ2_9ACTN|nr:ATP-binding protein [Streptomyces sp. SN-593]BBG20763.1 hypothetical protein RVR_P218 [Streptomyces sp. SN-593]
MLTTQRRTPDTGHRTGLALTDVVGNLTVTRTGYVTAWYVAEPQRWSFKTDRERNQLVLAHAQRLAELTGRRLYLRITHRPYPVARWAEALHRSVVNPLPGWESYLQEEQLQVARLPLDDKVIYYGVRLGRVSGAGRAANKVLRGALDRELAALGRDLTEIDRTMSAPGMDASPAQAHDMDWLLTRSIGLGLPAPLDPPPQPDSVWSPSDLAEHTDGVEWSAPEPYAPHLRIAGDRNGQRVERYVTILTMSRMDLPDIPESGYGPWLQRLDRLRFPYEVSGVFDVREPAQTDRDIRDQLDRIRHQVNHHAEHDVDVPLQLSRQRDQGRGIEDETRSGFSGLATRVHGWIRIAVSAATAEDVRNRADQVIKMYSPQVVIKRPSDQYTMAREFIPGEDLAHTGYRRRMPVTTLAGSLPAATALVGDRVGPHIGSTSGVSRRAVMWHPWMSTEQRERSGLTVVLSTLGGGKSTLCGKVVYDTTRMGVPWVVLDPSGPLTRLCDLPELRPYSRRIDLMRAEPGTLNPYHVIPDPRPEHYTPEQYADYDDPALEASLALQRDTQAAAAQRRTLAIDAMRGLLPAQITGSQQTQTALLLAAGRTDASVHSSPHAIIKELEAESGLGLAEHAGHLAKLLHAAAELPQGQLIFPPADGDDRYQTAHQRLVVMSLRGLTLPADGTPPSEWTLEEQYSMPLLYLAGWYAQRSIYDRDMNDRKGLFLDETHALLSVPSGRTLVKKTGRDSRKHNTRALYATQDGGDILTAGVENWVDSVFVGRTIGAQAQRAALGLLGIEPGHGYEEILEGLSNQSRSSNTRLGWREFIFNDGNDGMERITVRLDRPALRDALNSTANPHRSRSNPFVELAKDGNR